MGAGPPCRAGRARRRARRRRRLEPEGTDDPPVHGDGHRHARAVDGHVAGAGIDGHLDQHIVPRWTADANFFPIIAKTKALPQLLDEIREAVGDGSALDAQ